MAFVIQELGQNSNFSLKSRVLTRERIHVVKTYKYRISLRKLIRKLRIFFNNENVRKKLEVLAAFLSNQKLELLGLLPTYENI